MSEFIVYSQAMTLQPQPQLQPQPHHRRSHRLSTCPRHPTVTHITGFCALCLQERLAGIQGNSSTSNTPSTSQLRRSKSCSGGTNPSSSSAASEPRRKSCDLRVHNTLHDLFVIDDKIKTINLNHPASKVEAFQGFEEEEEEQGELKTMKEFIDLEWGRQKASGKSLWEAASAFSKKLKKWKKKQIKKEKKEGLVLEKVSQRGLRETQSEIGEYGFGRRSCDTDPRLSVDIGRLSVDDSRFSFDEPRASWDGYLIGKQNPKVNEEGNGGEERLSVVKEEERSSPGGSVQTRDYYADSLTRRRRSFDRSCSNRKVNLGDSEDIKSSISNAKVSPETVGLFHGAKLLVTEKELRDSNWYSNVRYGSKDIESGISQKGFNLKKVKRWKNVWNIWGLIQRRKGSELGDESRSIGGDATDGRLTDSSHKLRSVANGAESRCIGGNLGAVTLAESLLKLQSLANGDEGKVKGGNMADGTLAESLHKLRRVGNENANGSAVSQKLMRSYSVSARNSVDGSTFYRMSGSEPKGDGEKRRENFVLPQNRTVRYSPNNLDNGLLRFYLTPMRSYRRSKSGRSKLKNSHSVGGNGV